MKMSRVITAKQRGHSLPASSHDASRSWHRPKKDRAAATTTTTMMMKIRKTNLLPSPAFLVLLLLILSSFLQMMTSGNLDEKTAQQFAGIWNLREASYNGVLQELPADKKRTIEFNLEPQGAKNFRLAIHIANRMTTGITVLEQDDDDDDSGLSVKVGGVASTRMRPPPELEPLERFVSDYVPKLTHMKVVDEDTLEMEGPLIRIVCDKGDVDAQL